ncbi:MAG: SIR2 family protein, partial [Acidobacteriota bacterium]
LLRRRGEPSRFGTGFVIHRDPDSATLVTAAGVVQRLGGAEHLTVDDAPVTLLAQGEAGGALDLAVLRVAGNLQAPPLALDPISRPGGGLRSAGWTFLHTRYFRVRMIHSRFEPAPSGGSPQGIWRLRPAGTATFAPGNWGAPVVDEGSGCVVAVVTSEEDGMGLAVPIRALPRIWPRMPKALLDPQAPAAAEPAAAPRRVTFRHRALERHPPKRLVEEVASGQVVPVIGAGLSMSAATEGGGSIMPSYTELLRLLIGRAEDLGAPAPKLETARDLLRRGRHQDAVDSVRQALGLSFVRELRAILNPLGGRLMPSPAHKLLRVLDFPQLLTTNYDRLLEVFVAPEHEVVTPSDAFFGEFINQAIRGRFLFKIHGDITRPETISFGADRLEKLYSGEENLGGFLGELAMRKTFLFLGYSFEHASEGYVDLLRRYLAGSQRRHYALVPHGGSSRRFRERLTAEANILFLEYHPDQDHSQVWEFISYLGAGRRDEPRLGRKWARWYLSKERGRYLERQLLLEEKAASVRYVTPGLTNALATDAYLRQAPQPEFASKSGVPASMLRRRDHLERRLREGTLEVRCLFLLQMLDAELATGDAVVYARYSHVLELVRDPEVDLELRLIPDLGAEDLKLREATYALILGASPRPEVDVALAYASQATTVEYPDLHMIEINTETVEERLFRFERMWAGAWSEQRTVAYIEGRLAEASDG